MKCDKKHMLLYAVTDRAWVGRQSLYEQTEAALKGGATCVQLREKDLGEEEFLAEAMEIGALCRQYNVPFFINDNVDIAVKCKADGIHVGQDDMAADQVRRRVGNDMMIGVSVHSVEEALEAVKNGADCLGVGAVFSTSTKTDADVLSHDVVRDICQAVDIPVVAIGGINKSNIMQLSGTGVDGVALVSAIFGAEDIEGECRQLRKLSEEDNVDIAVKCKADGIHVGQDDMAADQVRRRVGNDMMIGVSVHSVEEALEAVKNGADCLGVGAVFSTSTKTDADVLSHDVVRDICQAVDIPVVAIGGINKSNIMQLSGTGVDGVALVSAIFGAEDIEGECRQLRKLSEEMVKA